MDKETPPAAAPNPSPATASPAPAAASPAPPEAPAPVPPATPAVDPFWSTWEALGAIFLLGTSQVLLGLALTALLDREASLEARLRVALPVLVVGSHLAGWTAVAWILGRRRSAEQSSEERGAGRWSRIRRSLALEAPPTRALWRPFGAGLALYAALLPLLAVFPPPPDVSNLFTGIFKSGGSALAVLFVTAVLLAPLLEETLFRGLLLPALRRRWAFWPAALAVTLLFTGMHVAQTGPYLPALAGIFACGLALARMRERTGSLWPPIAFHMGFNSTPFVVWLIAQPFGGLGDGPLG